MEPPPWDYSHIHYVNGAATHRVYGAICEKWLQLGGDRGFGAPVSEELPSTLGAASFACTNVHSTNPHARRAATKKVFRLTMFTSFNFYFF
jgi:hypothetical protein